MLLTCTRILTSGVSVGEAGAYHIILERALHTQLLADAAAANSMEKTYVGEAVA